MGQLKIEPIPFAPDFRGKTENFVFPHKWVKATRAKMTAFNLPKIGEVGATPHRSDVKTLDLLPEVPAHTPGFAGQGGLVLSPPWGGKFSATGDTRFLAG